jgi:hypothetical protein
MNQRLLDVLGPTSTPGARRRKAVLLGFAAVVAFAVTFAPQAARADFTTYGFSNITQTGQNNTGDSQYSVTVYSQGSTVNFGASPGSGNVTVGTNQVLFVFQNTGSFQSTIGQVYFQDGTLLGNSAGQPIAIYNSPTVQFNPNANPSNDPNGQALNPKFVTTEEFDAGATSPAPGNGVSNDAAGSQMLGVLFDLQTNPGTGNSYTYSDVITALANGFNSPSQVWNPNGSDIPGGLLGLRIGLHVINQPNGIASQSYLNGPQGPVVPAPPSVVLLGIGMALFGCMTWSRRRCPGVVA